MAPMKLAIFVSILYSFCTLWLSLLSVLVITNMSIDEAKFKDLLKEALEAQEAKLQKLLDAKLQPLTKSLDFICNSYDDLMKRSEKLEASVQSLKSENKILLSQVSNLSNELFQSKKDINDLEQYGRRESLEIKGIPTTQDEDTDEIVKSIGSLINVDINDEDISISHRLKPSRYSKGPPNIIVKFHRRNVRDYFLKARSSLRNHTTADLPGLGRQLKNKIYISENLTAKNKELFHKSLEVKKKYNFRFIWTRYGNIFMRKDASSPPVKITSQLDLDNIE